MTTLSGLNIVIRSKPFITAMFGVTPEREKWFRVPPGYSVGAEELRFKCSDDERRRWEKFRNLLPTVFGQRTRN
jgi:hypothetical protein